MTSHGPAEIYDMEDARTRRANDDMTPHAGAHLAALREAAGLSLKETAAKTHIKEQHLQAIETMDRAGLPPRPYAIGFVKSYAEFLDAEAEPIVRRFKEDAGFLAAAPVQTEPQKKGDPTPIDGGGDLSLIATAAIILFIIWCAYQITLPREERRLGAQPFEAAENENPAPVASPMEDATVIEARIIERVDPIYPPACLTDARPVETVVVAFTITTAGGVSSERVARTSNACFDDAALNAVRRWQFEPRRIDGSASAVFDQQYSFSFPRPR
ncbi:MAG: TonB family protein [Pseudomonadota bacterium]